MAERTAIAGALKKSSSKLAKATPFLSKAAGKIASSTKNVGRGTALAAGAVAGGVLNQVKDPGFFLFVAGMLTFIFYKYTANVVLTTIIVSIFMFYTSLFIFKGRGIVITALFWFWFVFLNTSTDPKYILYYLGPILLIGMLAHGLFFWLSKRGTFVEGSSSELTGLVPILVLVLDMGLVSILTQTFNISLNIWIQYIPWWGLLGLLTTKKKSTVFSILRGLGIFYICLIVFLGITPEAYGAYKSGSIGPEEFLKARETTEEQIAGAVSPLTLFWTQVKCMLGEPTDPDSCYKREKEKIEVKAICGGKGFEENTIAYDDCVKEETERKQKLQISGTIDTNIKEPTKIEFKTSEYFPKISYQPRYPYPAQLEIKNPREQKLAIDVACYFKKDGQNVTGLVQPNQITTSKKEDQKSITCTPAQDLKGRYKLIYRADIHDIKTTSTLKRLFIGDVSQKTKDEINALKSLYVSGQNYLSQAPDEFARLNFGFGEPETNPIIESDDDPLFVSTIENIGGGRILSIKNYYVDLGEEGIYPSHILTGEKIPLQTPGCFSGTNTDVQVPLRKSFVKEVIPLKSCFVALPDELKNPEDFIVKTFKGDLIYDYQIEKEIDIEVKILTP